MKDSKNDIIVDEFVQLIKEAHPDVIYTHNLADKHDTHIGVSTKVIKAIRKLKIEEDLNQFMDVRFGGI